MTAEWVKRNIQTYFGNATSVRDFRSQLRGNKPIFLWSTYLLLLIAFAYLYYTTETSRGEVSIAAVQASLSSFYQAIIIMLAIMVSVISPGLTATAVVAEKQRRSLELVQSSPVEPKYFLVGKMISGLRYTWMLLALSLPVTAVCVVMGGATWSDVLITYLLLSINGLIFTAIALVMSTIAPKPVTAVIWSFATIIFYLFATAMASSLAFTGMSGGFQAQLPFIVAFNPFMLVYTSGTFTELYGYHVPNWFLVTVAALMFCKLMLLGAASILSHYGSAETKSLRIHGLIYIGIVAYLLSLGMGTAPWGASMSGSGNVAGHTAAWFSVGLLVLAPMLSAFGFDVERKFRPDGVFNWRRMFLGTPSGNLPYILALNLIIYAAAYRGWIAATGTPPGNKFLHFFVYSLGTWIFFWAVGRYASSNMLGAKQARTMVVAVATVLGLLAPTMCLFVLYAGSAMHYEPGIGEPVTLLDFCIGTPLVTNSDKSRALVVGAVLLFIGVWIATLAQARLKRLAMRYGVEG